MKRNYKNDSNFDSDLSEISRNKRSHAQISHEEIPSIVSEFYTIIGSSNDFSSGKVIQLVTDQSFSLLLDSTGNEIQLTPKEFEKFHDHCFATPLLALCHVASQHNLKINDNDLKVMCEHLIKIGADVNARDEEGNTPLLLLASSHPERGLLENTIELLLLNNANLSDCNAESKTVLHLSFELMNFALTTTFYKLGAKVNARSDKDTYLLACEENDPSEIAKYIKDLIQHLKLQHLLADLPLEKDALFKVLEKNLKYNKIADYIDSNKPPISERSLRCIVEQIQDDDVVSSLFRSLDAKLKKLLLSPSGTDHFIFKHPSMAPEPVNEKLHHTGIQKRK